MSMLTPPGLSGKKYRITGDRYPRMRRPRRRRAVLAVAVAAAGLGLLGFGTLQLVDIFSGNAEPVAEAREKDDEECAPGARAASGEDAGGSTAGATAPAVLPEPEAITVNVYNATRLPGLARDTAEALEERGFVIGEVDNAPEELQDGVDGTGLLLATEEGRESGALAVLGAHLAGTETGLATGREGPEIDLVLGNEFEELADAEAAGERLALLVTAAAEPPSRC